MPIIVRSFIYNTPELYVRRAIESVLGQTFTDFNYIILDNGCTDNTKNILEEYAVRDSRIKLLRYEKNSYLHPNYRQEAKYVMGPVKKCVGEYTCVLDSDDWYEPDFFEKAHKLALEHNADMVVGSFEMISEKDPLLKSLRITPASICKSSEEIADYWTKNNLLLFSIWNKLVRSDIWDEAQSATLAFNVGVAGDSFFVQEIIRRSKIIASISDVTHHYLDRASSIKQDNFCEVKNIQAYVNLHKNALDVLSGMGVLNERYVKYFEANTRRLITTEVLPQLAKNAETHPYIALSYIEEVFSNFAVASIFNNLKEYRKLFFDALDLTAVIVSKNLDKEGITDTFMSKLAVIRAITEHSDNVNKDVVVGFFQTIYDERNPYRVGRFLMTDMLEAYQVPFADCIHFLSDDILLDPEFNNLILEKNSFLLLENLLKIANNTDDKEFISVLFDYIDINIDISAFTEEYCLSFAHETSLIYHDKHKKAVDSLEGRLNNALSFGDYEGAERVLEALLRAALAINDELLFRETRIRRLELFVAVGQNEKAKNEYEAITQLFNEDHLEEIRNATNYRII